MAKHAYMNFRIEPDYKAAILKVCERNKESASDHLRKVVIADLQRRQERREAIESIIIDSAETLLNPENSDLNREMVGLAVGIITFWLTGEDGTEALTDDELDKFVLMPRSFECRIYDELLHSWGGGSDGCSENEKKDIRWIARVMSKHVSEEAISIASWPTSKDFKELESIDSYLENGGTFGDVKE